MSKRRVAPSAADRKKPTAKPRAPRRAAIRPAQVLSDKFPTLLGRFPPAPMRPSSEEDTKAVKWLQKSAMQWAYIARNRRRWVGVPSLTDDQVKSARRLVESASFGTHNLVTLAHAQVVQVSVPWVSEESSWQNRIFPWEFFLSFATRELRDRKEALTVLRQLRRVKELAQIPPSVPKSVLFVATAPGRLDSLYSFDSERDLVRAALIPPDATPPNPTAIVWKEMFNPSAKVLEEEIKKSRPAVIHVAGFDIHQGRQLLGMDSPDPEERTSEGEPSPPRDGILMRNEAEPNGFENVEAEAFAKILTAGGHRPKVVTFSTWNSASRIAAQAVAQGAQAAMGFQDTFDDEIAEFFFASFYRRYRAADWDLREAFTAAWGHVRQLTPLEGTGIVLWSESQLIGEAAAGVPTPTADEDARKAMQIRLDEETSKLCTPESIALGEVETVLGLEVNLADEVNYSLLHNNQPLFTSFNILKKTAGRMIGIEVTVELSAGDTGAVYREHVDLRDEKADLRERIKVPLTAPLLRAIRETIVSSVFIEVKWGAHVLMRETRRVKLLPADQWCFADKGNTYIWLPSFVLPRDAAVKGLLDKAQRYVRVLRDDPTAGFEGYQAIDEERDDPTEDVDLQVQAIWSAIVHEWRLAYTNPPPTYSRGMESQRLRTPSAILAERFGTCIDTSLLFAAALEMVDIHPVIFMLNDHAFPGYWRSDTAHSEFLQMGGKWVSDMTLSELRDSRTRSGPDLGWVLDKSAHAEILRQVDEGNLVPVESTMLTEGSGFWAAIEAARENNFKKTAFHSMLDIGRAREAGVTPLPIWEQA
jgi:hypothetical protein